MDMWSKRWTKPERVRPVLLALCWCAGAGLAAAVTPHLPPAPPRHIKAVDADGHTLLLNRGGVVTALIGTSEDSQDAAREAGIALHPFQGRSDFQLIVAVDLRGSLANWAPSIATSRMRSSLDDEAVELRPFFLKNGNRSNPRGSCHVVPDFDGKLFTELGWPETSGTLRAIVYGANGREFQRFDQITNMDLLYNAVRAAIADYIEVRKARAAAAPATSATRPSALSPPAPPLPPARPITP
jgi:hypothetical protein